MIEEGRQDQKYLLWQGGEGKNPVLGSSPGGGGRLVLFRRNNTACIVIVNI
jgi:hypothetical protein